MIFCKDRQIRYYYFFLVAFVLLFFFLGIFVYIQQADMAKHLFLKHDQSVAGSLLEQGVSEDIIAKAITNTSHIEQGMGLLNKIGITEYTANRYFPFIADFHFVMLSPLP